MNIQKINQPSFRGNIILKENEENSLFVGGYYMDDPKAVDELEEIGNFAYDRNHKDKHDNRYFKDITLNTDNIKSMQKIYNGYEYYSLILYFLPKSKRNVDIVFFNDSNGHDRLISAYNKVKDTSLNVEV